MNFNLKIDHNKDAASKAVFGVYDSFVEVKKAFGVLNAQGFSRSDISMYVPNHSGPQDYPQRQKSCLRAGAVLGGMLGGILFAVASSFGSLGVEIDSYRMGRFFIVLGGIILGAFSGALVGIGTPESAGKRYSSYIKVGGVLVSVHAEGEDQIKKAKDLLESTGAQDISLINETKGWEVVKENTSDDFRL